MSDLLDFALSCCAAPDSHNGQRGLDRLRSYTTRDVVRWVFGTDGNAMVATPDPTTEAEPHHLGNLEKFLGGDPGGWFSTDVDALRAWAGPHDETCPDCTAEDRARICTACGGKSSWPCTCEACGTDHVAFCSGCNEVNWCVTCDNTGKVRLGLLDRVGEFRGSLLNLRLVARTLRLAPAGMAEVALLPGPGEETPLVVRGAGWRAVMMPLRAATIAATPVPLEDVAVAR